MPDRGSAEILIDAIRETSTSMRETAVEMREVSNAIAAHSKAIDEMRAEHRRSCEVMGRVEDYLKIVSDEKTDRRTSSAALFQSIRDLLRAPAVQFVLMAFAFWAAAKLGVLQYLGVMEVTHAP